MNQLVCVKETVICGGVNDHQNLKNMSPDAIHNPISSMMEENPNICVLPDRKAVLLAQAWICG